MMGIFNLKNAIDKIIKINDLNSKNVSIFI